MKGPFRGSLTALPTPFRNGAVDFAALQRLVDFQLDNGTDGLVAAALLETCSVSHMVRTGRSA